MSLSTDTMSSFEKATEEALKLFDPSFVNHSEEPSEETFFRLEPGRITHHKMTICDLSHQCVEVEPLPIAVIRKI